MRPDFVAKFALNDWFNPDLGPAAQQFTQFWLKQIGVAGDEAFFSPKLNQIPDPFTLKDLKAGAQLIIDCMDRGGRLLVLGDYDVDGVTATALLIRFFNKIGFQNFLSVIPNRFTEGYGLTEAVIARVAGLKPDLVVTVDNGIAAGPEVAQLKAVGIEVLVTDHHLLIPGREPQGLVINPKQPDCHFSEPDLSGVGVAFMLILGVRRLLRERGRWSDQGPNLLEDLDLVAIGTVADQVPMKGLNRLLTRHGLEQMNRRLVEADRDGSSAYLKVLWGGMGDFIPETEAIAFRLGPLLNAAGRMEDAGLALDFLKPQPLAQADLALTRLEALNKERRRVQNKSAKKAVKLAELQVGRPGIVVYDPEFHIGLIGIIASRLVEQFEVPVMVLSKDSQGMLKGSARSAGGDLALILKDCDLELVTWGGHAQAAGCLLSPARLEAFKELFWQSARQHHPAQANKTKADFELSLEMVNHELMDAVKALEPFGQGNRKPRFMLSQLRLANPFLMANKHLKWALRPGVELIRWNGADETWPQGNYRLAYSLNQNRYRGQVSLQLVIENFLSLD